MQIRSKVNHDRLAAWTETMKKVYDEAISARAASGEANGADLGKIRNHLECLAMIPEMLKEHQEMLNGINRDFGRFNLILSTQATLIKASGEVIDIPRRPKSMSLAWDHGGSEASPRRGEENG